MRLYDESIGDILAHLPKTGARRLDVSDEASKWPDAGEGSMILRGDMAYELGGCNCYASTGLAITSDAGLVPEDEVLLYGKDIGDCTEDISYARIAIVRVAEDSLGDNNQLYNNIRKIEYVRYHVNPLGYMTRISASNDREPVRIGREAVADGLNFSKVGKMFLDTYHENDKIEAVKLIFITLEDFDYGTMTEVLKKNEQITAAIDHIMKNVTMDCNACNLKPICDEVEGMKELHFGASQK